MSTFTKMEIAHLRKGGLLETAGAWSFQGIDNEIIHTGGNIYCVVHYLSNGWVAVRGEGGFSIFTNDDWNEWIEETETVLEDDYELQVDWIRAIENGSTEFTLKG